MPKRATAHAIPASAPELRERKPDCANKWSDLAFHGRRESQCTTVRRCSRPGGPYNQGAARVVKQVDTRDLKSLDRKVIPVRLRSRAPKQKTGERDDRLGDDDLAELRAVQRT